MMPSRVSETLRRFVVGCLLCSALVVSPLVRGADPAFVGVLALAVEEETAKQLGLSEETRTKLQDLIDAREEAVAALVLEIRNLSAEEKAAKLKPFVAESEKRGLALLSAEQKKKLEQIRIARDGTAVLLDAAIAAKIGLSDEQIEKLQAIADKMKAESAPAAERERFQIRIKYEREMVALLDKTQRAAWEKLSGVGGETDVASNDDPPANETKLATPKEEPADEPTTDEPKPEPRTTKPENSDDPFPAEGVPSTPPKPETTRPGSRFPPSSTKPTTPATPSPSKTDTNKSEVVKTAPKPPIDRENVRLKFNFHLAPWKSVLEWFAEQSDYSLVGENIPVGTFNYKDNRTYTPAEALDLLNGILIPTKGHSLVLRGRMLLVINLEDGSVDGIVRDVQPEQLKSLGEYELVRCLFTLDKMAPEDAETEIRKLLGPQGKLTVLPKSRQVYVTEVGSKLRSIQRIIEAVENPAVPRDEKVVAITLQHVTPGEFLPLLRPLMGMADNANTLPDQSLRISVDEAGGRLLLTGKPDRIKQVQDITLLLDIDGGRSEDVEPEAPPQLEVYNVAPADPAIALQILQTLLAGNPNIRLTTDAKTGNLVAWAPPKVHGTIRETLSQLSRGDGKQTEVIKLKKLDPQAAMLAITKLFGGEEGKEGSGPKIDADPTTMTLMIRGSKTQIADIQTLLQKLGEGGGPLTDEPVERTSTRFLPIPLRAQDSAIDQVQQLWPTVRPQNRIRPITPSRSRENGELDRRRPAEEPQPPADDRKTPDREREARRGIRTVFVSEFKTAQLPAAEEEVPAEEPEPKKPKKVSKPGAEIIITRGPKGLIIASEDLDALDDLEKLFATVTESTARTGREFTIFYLKYSKADSAAELLREAMGSAPASSESSGGGGGLLGDLAGGLLGDSGGLLGSLLGGGGGGGSSSSSSSSSSTGMTIIPDNRLNALLVNASPTDIDMMEQLLKVIDQPSSPESVETIARPKLIPVINTKADEVAVVVRQVYAGRITADSNQQRQPSPEDLVRALRGGRGGGQQQSKKAEEQKITIGVDARTNSLVVSAPEYLYQEIRELVTRLDTPVSTSDEMVKVVTLKRSSPESMQRTLTSVLGDQIKTNTAPQGGNRPQGPAMGGGMQNMSGRSQGGGNRGQGGGGQQGGGGDLLQQLQRLEQGLNRGAGGGGGFQGGGGNRGGGGGFGGGGGGRGGR